MKNQKNILNELFVLELANNHWGQLDRGKKIIHQFGEVVRSNNIHAAIKLQFRNVDSFIHKKYKGNTDNRYIWKTEKTKSSKEFYAELIKHIKLVNCIPMATPFDEESVDWCKEFDLKIIKIASSDINDWNLIKKIAPLKNPVIISTGGAYDKNINDVVQFFDNRSIPIAINHCVSKYPSENSELELNQIDYLKTQFPDKIIGLSTHEYHDWSSSMLISYAKGVRTWERHIDIDDGNFEISKYCSTPNQIDTWFKAYHTAKTMCGGSLIERRIIDEKETSYLHSLYRGLYFNSNMKKGQLVTNDNLYAAIPYLKNINHISSRDFIENDILTKDVSIDDPLTKDVI